MREASAELDPVWARALQIARSPHIASSWQPALASAIEAAIRPDACAFFLCALGNMLDATCAVAPAEQMSLGSRLLQDFLPRMLDAGLDTPWDFLAPATDQRAAAITLPMRSELLEPAGFKALSGHVLRSRDAKIGGWICVFSRSSRAERRLETDALLSRVCQAAEDTLRTAISIASAVGARFPKSCPALLSGREREVARLAAAGLSDVNIAERLHISEGTVGRHLHKIFRKLGASSRWELVDLLGPGA
jgi:DNA-binding CsgD family transcriptional regulator